MSDTEPTASVTPPRPANFASCVRGAVNVAMQDFDHVIATTIIAPDKKAALIRRHLRKEYDWRSEEFSVRDAVDTFMHDKDDYFDVADQSRDLDMLYEGLSALANSHIEDLVFYSNNYPEAAIRRDQWAHFTHAATDALRDAGLMAADDDRFDRLTNGYNTALLGYLDLRELVAAKTDNRFASLLEWATADELASQPEGAELDEETVAQRMAGYYRELAEDLGMSMPDSDLVPVPFFYLSRRAREIAVRDVMNGNPLQKDSQAIECASVEPYAALLGRAVEAAGLPLTMAGITSAEKLLDAEYARTFNLPEDFRQMVQQAARHARRHVEQALPAIAKRTGRDMSEIRKARGHQYMMEQGIDPYEYPLLERITKHWSHEVGLELEDLPSVQRLATLFDEDADAAVYEATCGLEHPGTILMRGQYAEAFGKDLVRHLKERGYPTREIAERFDAVVAKFDYGYQAYWETARWCMNQSDNAYANFGEWALMLVMARHGKTYPQLTMDEKMTVPDYAHAYLREAAASREVPEQWAGHMYLPLIYRRVLQHCADQQQRTIDREPLFSDLRKPDAPYTENEKTLLRAETKKLRAELGDAMKPVLERTMAMFSAHVPDQSGIPATPGKLSQETPPFVDSVTLKQAMQFFDDGAVRGRAH